MTNPVGNITTGFHEGELAVQRAAGVARDAARLTGMLAPANLRGAVTRFLAERTFAAITARDADGALWTSPLAGPHGFLHVASPTTLDVRTLPAAGDPLENVEAGQPVGLIVVEFAIRRRLRINGTLSRTDADGLRIDVEQAYGNCPQYIQSRHLHTAPAPAPGTEPVRRGQTLTADDIELVRRADTFLIGTTHPVRGNDASHRGGPPGFVRVENGELWWPDYWGNNMFNTLGNLRADPTTALLFCDFTVGHTLQLSGRAALEWTGTGVPGDDDDTGRRVHFIPERLVAGRLLPLAADTVTAAPDNPPIT
ncbi:pyridoxamine 5'-phosphate oxidase family protein [Streptomyces sp. 8L]|uniref:pyridoxamine 5'-phosphate oxidase family protein n=1 Tax=Streptomyces sp. 8L TaxID=2877242 RepID=UPI001CD35161|nr:pyridoxamine 5'-phosphate oxidase family protein [Streptomyces sp. 8L]MCA1217227.1 pyridoxamine 5'-phosphate oxidase family protein [Streptomyces sp. 8L]